MSKPDLLVISPTYASFVKDPVETMAGHFGRVKVAVTHNPVAGIANWLPIDSLRPFTWKEKVDVSGKPENVEIVAAPTYYLPTDRMYKKLPEHTFRAVEKLLKRPAGFDLSHAHFASPQGCVGVRLKEKYGIPSIISVHGYDVYDLPFRDEGWRKQIVSTLDAADHVITVSHSNLQLLKKLRVTAPVTVIPNGFRADAFYPLDRTSCRQKLRLPAGRKMVVTVGTLAAIKGHEHLIRAMRFVADSGKDAFCVIVGSGGLRGSLQALIRRLKLDGTVILAGPKPHGEIPLWMGAADLFVLPSLGEGNPTVMFECLGCGRPFIGTRVGGIPEHITSDDLGCLVEPGNPGQLADAMAVALDTAWDSDLIRGYSKQFTWENAIRQYLDVYGQVLGRDLAKTYGQEITAA